MKAQITFIAAALSAMGLANAAVTAEEAARLGKDLTPWGAEMAGNKEGTIPAYTGGLPVDLMGPGYDSNKSVIEGRHTQPDPFKDEKPLYRITAKNLDQYADKLSEATKALFKNDPNFFMDVYPTHRVVNYPKYYIESSIKNATRCKIDETGEGVTGCKGGMPFPIPKTGTELIFNLQLGAYFGPGVDLDISGGYVDRNGSIVKTVESVVPYQSPYHDPRYSLEDFENTKNPYGKQYWKMQATRVAPARIAGEANFIIFHTDNRNAASFTYQPGNRRVRATPNVEYDFPVASTGGSAFYDETNVFAGRKDKFEWKMLGKKEMIMPYSNYRLAQGPMEKVMMAGHPKPEYARWELHRAWVVEATRKPGARHAFAKRRYYIDEDTPAAALGDNFDDGGKIMHGNFGTALWIWDYQVNNQYYWTIDLVSGIYSSTVIPDQMVGGTRFRNPNTGLGGMTPGGAIVPDVAFTPDALTRTSQR